MFELAMSPINLPEREREIAADLRRRQLLKTLHEADAPRASAATSSPRRAGFPAQAGQR